MKTISVEQEGDADEEDESSVDAESSVIKSPPKKPRTAAEVHFERMIRSDVTQRKTLPSGEWSHDVLHVDVSHLAALLHVSPVAHNLRHNALLDLAAVAFKSHPTFDCAIDQSVCICVVKRRRRRRRRRRGHHRALGLSEYENMMYI